MWLQDLHIYTWGLPGGRLWRCKLEYRLPGLVGKLSEQLDAERPGAGVLELTRWALAFEEFLTLPSLTITDVLAWVHDHGARFIAEGDHDARQSKD